MRLKKLQHIPMEAFGDFIKQCVTEPVVITDAMRNWPATQKDSAREWTIPKLRSRNMTDIVPVEFGGHYMSTEFQQHHIELQELLDFFAKQQQQQNESSSINHNHVYLAQHDLTLLSDLYVDVTKDVIKDVVMAKVGRGIPQKSNIWLGSAGSMSPAHRDPYYNLLCQVMGEKSVRLFPYEIGDKYLYPALGTQKNTSRVSDLDHPGPMFPLVHKANEYGWETTILPGESLYIPHKAWHYCVSKTLSISVNWWWI